MTTKPNIMAEDAGAQTPASQQPPKGGTPNPDEQQTVEVPLSAFPTPPQPGSSIQLKVISVDQGAGVVNAAVATPEAPDEEGGSDSMAREFDREPNQGR